MPEKGEPELKDSKTHRNISMVKKDPVYSHHVWRRYASPVWMDINQSNTLQKESARENKDERHICPLQLDVIERGLELWTNPNDTVLSPFAGIGSEIYSAVKMGRRGVGIELKESYYECAVNNLKALDVEMKQGTLFELEGEVSSKVSKGNIISEINQRAEEVKIQASRIRLEGTITANGKF